jgi:hypothetical protein
LLNAIMSHFRGAEAGPDPWRADTLEWATSSPPPEYNFAEVPVVEGRHPLWDQDPLAVASDGHDPATASLTLEGAVERLTPVTTGLDAHPERRLRIPEPSALPCLLALGVAVFFAGLLVSAELVLVIGVLIGLVGLTRWAWHTDEERT